MSGSYYIIAALLMFGTQALNLWRTYINGRTTQRKAAEITEKVAEVEKIAVEVNLRLDGSLEDFKRDTRAQIADLKAQLLAAVTAGVMAEAMGNLRGRAEQHQEKEDRDEARDETARRARGEKNDA